MSSTKFVIFGPIFLADRKKQDGHPGLWLAETFLTSFLKHLNGIQRNLSGNKITTSSTMFVFFWLIRKTIWPHWPLIDWDIFGFFSETAERNSIKLDRKQDINVLYQICVFRADQKTKMAALADSSKRWHIVLRCTICGPLSLLFWPYNKYAKVFRAQEPKAPVTYCDHALSGVRPSSVVR